MTAAPEGFSSGGLPLGIIHCPRAGYWLAVRTREWNVRKDIFFEREKEKE